MSFGVDGGVGDLRMGVLQALQIETLVEMMGPRENGVIFRGDLVGDRAESRPPGRLFARYVRPERDLLRSFGAMVDRL